MTPSAMAKETGLVARVKRAGLGLAAARIFASLFILPTKTNALPDTSRMQPVW